MRAMENAYKFFVGAPEGKRPFGRPRHRFQDTFKIDFKGIVCDGVDWIDMAQDRGRWRALANTVMNGDGCFLGCNAV
jgi:hypothetical protein